LEQTSVSITCVTLLNCAVFDSLFFNGRRNRQLPSGPRTDRCMQYYRTGLLRNSSLCNPKPKPPKETSLIQGRPDALKPGAKPHDENASGADASHAREVNQRKTVVVDLNNPLACTTQTFDVKIKDIKEASVPK
jgi:hypothetical protein